MPPTELPNFFLRFRLDALCFAAVILGACTLCQIILRRRQAEKGFWRLTCPIMALLAIAGIFFAEWVGTIIGPVFSVPSAALGARMIALGVMTFLAAVLLWSAVMSHEIRTPLNAVMGFANLLSDTKPDEAQREYLATINREGRRLTALISDILDLTKIEEGRLALERLPFAPVETANEVLRLLSPQAMEKKLDLRFEAQIAGPLLIAGDPLRFRQVLLNLIDNAIKFTAQGSVTLFLHWTPPARAESQGQLAVRVQDTGIGIPAEKLKNLFQKFMQADTSTTRRYGGTGLGLAICQRLVALMSGEIAVRSEPGEGTEFSFTIPAASVAPPEDMLVAPAEPSSPSAHRPCILIVDDVDTNRFLREVFLTRNGFEPEFAAGGAEAIRLAGAQKYDAILMDLQMPMLTVSRPRKESASPNHPDTALPFSPSPPASPREPGENASRWAWTSI
ncbi:MAG: response regulator [Opitutus sp.]|nr:response regulator [Opitutus sp.]